MSQILTWLAAVVPPLVLFALTTSFHGRRLDVASKLPAGCRERVMIEYEVRRQIMDRYRAVRSAFQWALALVVVLIVLVIDVVYAGVSGHPSVIFEPLVKFAALVAAAVNDGWGQSDAGLPVWVGVLTMWGVVVLLTLPFTIVKQLLVLRRVFEAGDEAEEGRAERSGQTGQSGEGT